MYMYSTFVKFATSNRSRAVHHNYDTFSKPWLLNTESNGGAVQEGAGKWLLTYFQFDVEVERFEILQTKSKNNFSVFKKL